MSDDQNNVSSGYETGREIETNVEKCPSCGGNMVYSPARGALECPYCGTIREIKANNATEQEFTKLLEENNSWSDETHVFRCENCGATTILDANEISKRCPFCGASHVVETKEMCGIKPNAVVPFVLTAEEACEKFKTWVKKKFFVPRKFKKEVKADEIGGVYNPAFSFDTSTFSTYSGRLGKRYTETRTVNGKTVTETKVKYFPVSGDYSCFFDDVLIQASDAISQKNVDAMQPFDTNDSREYNKQYLSGYSASRYTTSGTDCWEVAKQRIKGWVRTAILARYDYDVIDYLNVNTSCENITYKYLLLPVYVGATRWKKKVYNFFVNGRNGKVAGKMPLSPLKILGVVVLGLAAIGLFAYFYLKNGG